MPPRKQIFENRFWFRKTLLPSNFNKSPSGSSVWTEEACSMEQCLSLDLSGTLKMFFGWSSMKQCQDTLLLYSSLQHLIIWKSGREKISALWTVHANFRLLSRTWLDFSSSVACTFILSGVLKWKNSLNLEPKLLEVPKAEFTVLQPLTDSRRFCDHVLFYNLFFSKSVTSWMLSGRSRNIMSLQLPYSNQRSDG